MTDLNLILPEIFISLSIMFLLIFGVFKSKSSNLVYNLSIIFLTITLALTFNYPLNTNFSLFTNSYKIDYLSSFMKILLIMLLVTVTVYLFLINLKVLKI